MSLSLRTVDLERLNSLTKYPSIPTYHPLDPKQPRSRGKVADVLPSVRFDGPVLITEKIDGTNARVILLPDGSHLIGSREELLYARGDLLHNPAMSIVPAIRNTAESLIGRLVDPAAITVVYGEVYGGNVSGASREYTSTRQFGYRLFDVARIASYDELLELPVERISAWRDGGGQPFLSEEALQRISSDNELSLTPRLGEIEAGAMPTSIEATAALLHEWIGSTKAALDDQAGMQPEGLVLRTPSRSVIAKVRYKDYGQTPRRAK
jgi:hypothetical protein